MERKKFIKTLSAFAVSSPLVWLAACSKDRGFATETTPDPGCEITPSETAGPFPTRTPDSYIRSDIRKGDGIGTNMESHIRIVNVNEDCQPMEGILVDIWHCDIQGNYSQYGSVNETNWFRGRQVTNADGFVKFTTIFPGWYTRRSAHIHVHIYNRTGTSLLITQIAFQDSLAQTVYGTGSRYGYQGLSGYTFNNADSIFRDSVQRQVATVTGSLEDGFTLNATLKVRA